MRAFNLDRRLVRMLGLVSRDRYRESLTKFHVEVSGGPVRAVACDGRRMLMVEGEGLDVVGLEALEEGGEETTTGNTGSTGREKGEGEDGKQKEPYGVGREGMVRPPRVYPDWRRVFKEGKQVTPMSGDVYVSIHVNPRLFGEALLAMADLLETGWVECDECDAAKSLSGSMVEMRVWLDGCSAIQVSGGNVDGVTVRLAMMPIRA